MPVQSVRDSGDTPCCFRSVRGGGVRLVWEVTSRCNLSCSHCFVERHDRALSTEEALRSIREFPTIPITKVMITGGEPFLRRDLLHLVDACLGQGALVDITTNLTLVTPQRVEALARLGLQEVTTSLDGPEEAHDRIRRAPGNFERVTSTIQELRQAGIAVDVVSVAQRANADMIGETIDIAYGIGASSITISGFIRRRIPARRSREIHLRSGQLERVREQISDARQRYGQRLPIRTVALLERFDDAVPCSVEDLLAINARGMVSRCLLASVPDLLMGDVRQGLKRAWDSLNRSYGCS